jgi:hypothetical protein
MAPPLSRRRHFRFVPSDEAGFQVGVNFGFDPRIALSAYLDGRREFPSFNEFV